MSEETYPGVPPGRVCGQFDGDDGDERDRVRWLSSFQSDGGTQTTPSIINYRKNLRSRMNSKDPVNGPSSMSTSTVEPPSTVGLSSTVEPPGSGPSKMAYLVGEELIRNRELLSSLKRMEMGYSIFDERESDISEIDVKSSIIIFENFSGSFFESIKRKYRFIIFGPPAIIDAAQCPNIKLPVCSSNYPIYCNIMVNAKISVTGLKTIDHKGELRKLILYMNGVMYEDEGPFLTHLLAGKPRGSKYRDAVALGKPILRPEWIDFLWERRDDTKLNSNSFLDEFKLQTFHELRIAFDGFNEADESEMAKLLESNGGILVKPDDLTATHIVRSRPCENSGFENSFAHLCPSLNSSVSCEPEVALLNLSPMKRARVGLDVINLAEEKNKIELGLYTNKDYAEKARIVDVDWFWSSIQLEACADETKYSNEINCTTEQDRDLTNASIDTPNFSFTSPTCVLSDDGTPKSSNTPSSMGRRKRKRAKDEFISSLAQIDSPHFYPIVSDANLGGRSLEQSHYSENISDLMFQDILNKTSAFLEQSDAQMRTMTKRQHEFRELLRTERQYVDKLIVVVKDFKEPCEADDIRSGRLLNTQEVKTIFGDILPIFSLHRRILRDLVEVYSNWNEENLIGQIFCNYSTELQKYYERYINSYESIKAEINRCELEKHRFLAMLKLAQKNNPKCDRQHLADLMMRPVQRLPSVELIVKNLYKNTAETNPDKEWISKGLEAITRVNKNINEEKRVNDDRVALFEMFSEIEGCPVDIVSSKRTILGKFDVTALNDNPIEEYAKYQKYDLITMICFQDIFIVVKRKGHSNPNKLSTAASVANLARSPSISRKMTLGGHNNSHHKRYKYLGSIHNSRIRRVVDICDLTIPSFALIIHTDTDIMKPDKMLAFTVPDDPAWDKFKTINLFAKLPRWDALDFNIDLMVVRVDSKALGLSVAENPSANVLEKAAKFATKTSRKVSRALSLSGRTPSKLKRTFSQMVSPFSSKNQNDSRDSRDFDSMSTTGSIKSTSSSTTPLRNHLSSLSLLKFGTKRGTMEPPSTPKTPKSKYSHRGNLTETFVRCKEM